MKKKMNSLLISDLALSDSSDESLGCTSGSYWHQNIDKSTDVETSGSSVSSTDYSSGVPCTSRRRTNNVRKRKNLPEHSTLMPSKRVKTAPDSSCLPTSFLNICRKLDRGPTEKDPERSVFDGNVSDTGDPEKEYPLCHDYEISEDGDEEDELGEVTEIDEKDTIAVDDDNIDPDTTFVVGSLRVPTPANRDKHHEYTDQKFETIVVQGNEVRVTRSLRNIMARVFSKDNFQFSQSQTFLDLARGQGLSALDSAVSFMLSNSGIKLDGGSSLCRTVVPSEHIKVINVISEIAKRSNTDNDYGPAQEAFCSTGGGFGTRKTSGRSNRLFTTCFPSRNVQYPSSLPAQKVQAVWKKVIFYREIHHVVSLYLHLVYMQRAINNDNTNSLRYAEGIVTKMLNLLDRIPVEEMSRDKYRSVGRDVLYLYMNVITDITGPKHYKRLRIPHRQTEFCFILAMLINDVPIVSDLYLSNHATNLVQFVSALSEPAYMMAVHKLSWVFNSSYSVCKVLGLEREMWMKANVTLSILSVNSQFLCKRKPKIVTHGVYLNLRPSLRSELRSSGLTTEVNSMRTTFKQLSRNLGQIGVYDRTIDDGCTILKGTHENKNGVVVKCMGSRSRDLKKVGLALILADRLRRSLYCNRPYF